MIHRLILPLRTEQLLKRAVKIQLLLLEYGAAQATLEPTTCDTFLQNHRLPTTIREWLWEGNNDNRRKLLSRLESFASEPEITPGEKMDWVVRLKDDVDRLYLEDPAGTLTRCREDNLRPWLKMGMDFLGLWYDIFSKEKLPADVVGDTNSFNRYDFLKLFIDNNKHLVVCAVCEQSGFRTHAVSEIRGTIDHYFLKTHYPHLCIHPYNLLPTCHLCNSSIKAQKDPLWPEGATVPRHLKVVPRPFHGDHLAKETYLKVDLGGGLNDAELTELLPRQPGNVGVKELCKVIVEVYDVPGRWDRDRHAIGERLFRRLYQYLRESDAFSEKGYTHRQLLAMIDRFVASLHDEDLGKEPYAFAMTWWMATIGRAHVEPRAASPLDKFSKDPFVGQVVKWRKKAADRSRQLGQRGQELRKIVPKP